jgi:hypothetical protein
VLRLVPQFQGRFAVVHPLFWGQGQREGERLSLIIRKLFASAPPVINWLETTSGVRALRVNGTRVEPSGQAGVYARFKITPVVLQQGAELTWEPVQ